MRRLTPATLAASLVVTATAVLAPVQPAAAAPADLSVTAGPPGTRVEVSVADCGTFDDFTFLEVRLLSGTGPDEVLAGAGGGFDGSPAALIVPDWIDPDDPAVVEAACFDIDGDLVRTYDPTPFDVEPGVDPGTQSRSASRTSLQAGQALTIDGTGCTFPGAEYAEAVVFTGDDRTGRTFDVPVAGGFSLLLADGSSATEVWLTDAGVSWGYTSFDSGPSVIDFIEEHPNSIAPGPHTLVPYCSADDGTTLLLEPVILDVTGTAPSDRIDLTAPAGSSVATLAGDTCAAGPVEVELIADPLEFDDALLDDIGFDDVALVRATGADRAAGPGPFTPSGAEAAQGAADGSLARALSDEGFVVETVVPDATGAWSLAADSGLDLGVVLGFAICGDPFADGFVYDPQIVAIDVPAPAPAPPAPTPVVAAPSPAGAIPGRPAYTG